MSRRSRPRFRQAASSADDEELHRQFVRGSPQGNAGKGRTGHLAPPNRRLAIATSSAWTARRLSRSTQLSRPIVTKLVGWYASGGISARHGAGNTAKSATGEIWLGDLDSNQLNYPPPDIAVTGDNAVISF